MTETPELVLANGRVHAVPGDDPHGAVAVRDGRIVAVGADAARGAADAERTIDLDGRTVLPGFVDAHTHMEVVGAYELEADLREAGSVEGCLDRLTALRDERPVTDGSADDEWLRGFGYDESAWDGEPLRAGQLDRVSTERPVVAYREDMHLASVNGVVLDRYGEELPGEYVRTAGGEPTGVLVEDAVEVVRDHAAAGPERAREYLLAAQERANARGVTGVHDMVRRSHAPRIYRELDRADELTLRVRINYWRDHLDAVLETGLATNHGSERVRVGGIKTFTDGSIGGHTARLSEPYADRPGGADGGEGPDDGDVAGPDSDREDGSHGNGSGAGDRGEWVVEPDELAALVGRVDDAGLQTTAHAIGDEAIAATLDAYEGTDGRRHRIEHAEVLTDDLIERLGDADVVVSAQPNFLKWAREDGLYDRRLGEERRLASNRFADLLAAGATLAFGSDCMPLDPLFGIEQAVTAPAPGQRLSVTQAVRAYTAGAAYAGFDEGRVGTLEPGHHADMVVLGESPWEADDVAGIDVALTLVGGEVVHDGRDR